MSEVKKCPTCGSEIPAEAADGLCLKCLGRLGFFLESGEPAPGTLLRLGGYELLEEIARGGMGVVYRARQVSLNRIVALKVVLHGPFSSPDFVRRFRHEAQVIATLQHPNIVAIHEIGEHNGTHFISLEFVAGQNFSSLVRERPMLSQRAADYLKLIAEAVEHAHQRGVLHRDLKPSNILLDMFDQPRVTDFGLAKLVNQDAGLTVTGQVLGSPNYMPPEQAAGKFSDSTVQSDVYSLGAILYELLTGRPPFQGETLQSVLAQVQGAEPVPPRRLNPNTPVDLQTICLKCLRKEPARRYVSAQALADDLGRFIGHQPIHARPVSRGERIWLSCRRHPWLALVSTGLVAAVILGVAGIAWEWRQSEFHAQGESRQRIIAEKDAADTRLNLYAADVAVASEVIQDGNFGLARRTLEQLRPQPGETDLRGFEWYYLWNQCRGEQQATLTGHALTVTCTAFSPDGKWIATGSQDGTAKIWSVARHAWLKTFAAATNGVCSVAFLPDGKSLLVASQGGVEFWNVDSGRLEKTFPGELAVLAKTGTLMATAEASPFYWEPGGVVRLWNWRTGEMLYQFDQPGRGLALSADGNLLAIASTNCGVAVWDTVTKKCLQDWPTKTPVGSLEFSPTGRELMVTDWTRDVSLWPVAGDHPPRILSGHQLHVWSATFSADGATIATASSDQTVRLWDAATLAPKTILRGHDSEVWCAAFSPDGKWLVTGGKDKNVLLWSATSPNLPPTDLPHKTGLGPRDVRPIFSPTGKWLITVDPRSGNSLLWDARQSTLVTSNLANGDTVIGFSSDETSVATFDAETAKLKFWLPDQSLPASEVRLENAAPETRPIFLGLSVAADFFFAVDDAGRIRIWNTHTGHLLRTIEYPLPRIRNVMLSPNGEQIAVCGELENVVRLYDCATGKERILTGHSDFVSGLAFSSDGQTLATGSMDGTIRLWHTATGEAGGSLPGHMQETTDVAFSPDGRTLASVGRGESLKFWHLPTSREVISENEPDAGVWLRFSPDGRQLAVATDAGTLRLLAAPAE